MNVPMNATMVNAARCVSNEKADIG